MKFDHIIDQLEAAIQRGENILGMVLLSKHLRVRATLCVDIYNLYVKCPLIGKAQIDAVIHPNKGLWQGDACSKDGIPLYKIPGESLNSFQQRMTFNYKL